MDCVCALFLAVSSNFTETSRGFKKVIPQELAEWGADNSSELWKRGSDDWEKI